MSKTADTDKSRRVLEVSKEAVINIKQFMKENNVTSSGLRIVAGRDDCGCINYQLHLEEGSHEDDTIVEEDGLIIFIDPASVELIRGSRMGFAETPDGGGFTFDNPNDHHMH